MNRLSKYKIKVPRVCKIERGIKETPLNQLTDVWRDGWTDGHRDCWMGGWTYGRMEESTNGGPFFLRYHNHVI
jgi:hypothetical protein